MGLWLTTYSKVWVTAHSSRSRTLVYIFTYCPTITGLSLTSVEPLATPCIPSNAHHTTNKGRVGMRRGHWRMETRGIHGNSQKSMLQDGYWAAELWLHTQTLSRIRLIENSTWWRMNTDMTPDVSSHLSLLALFCLLICPKVPLCSPPGCRCLSSERESSKTESKHQVRAVPLWFIKTTNHPSLLVNVFISVNEWGFDLSQLIDIYTYTYTL